MSSICYQLPIIVQELAIILSTFNLFQKSDFVPAFDKTPGDNVELCPSDSAGAVCSIVQCEIPL